MLTPRGLFFAEKWYFDAQQPDGSFAFAFVALLTLLGRRSLELVAGAFPAEGAPVVRGLHMPGRDVRVSADRERLDFPCGAISAGGAARFEARAGDLDVRMDYRRLDAAWIPGGDGILHRDGGRALLWTVTLPCGEAEARLRIGDVDVRLQGHGYADFVQTDIPPWSLGLRELHWGRALGAQGAIIWELPEFAGPDGLPQTAPRGWMRLGTGPTRTFEMLAVEPLREEAAENGRGLYPTELRIAMGDMDVRVDRSRLVMARSVTEMNRMGGTLDRLIFRRASGNAPVLKLVSRATAGGVSLLAAHERMRIAPRSPRVPATRS